MPTSRLVGSGLVILGAAIAALLPVFVVVYPSFGIGQADAGNPVVVLPVVAANPALVAGPAVMEILGHAVGAAAILGLWVRSGGKSFLLTAATLAGLAWTCIDLVDNALTLQLAPALATRFVAGDPTAAAAYVNASSLIDAIRLAGHFGAGSWVVGVSLVGIRAHSMPMLVGGAGVVIGAVLAANPFVPALLNISFVTLPLWLVLFGLAVARDRRATAPATLPAIGAVQA